MPPQKGCHLIVNCLVISIVHEFIHGGELNDDFTTLLDEGVKQRFVTSTRNVFSWTDIYILAVLAVLEMSTILLNYQTCYLHG